MKSEKMKLEDAKKQHNVFKSNLNQILEGRYKLKKQKSALENIKLLDESRKVVIELFDEYSLIVSEAKHKAKDREGLKILSPKQMLQRLPIALAQIKASSTSENLLN